MNDMLGSPLTRAMGRGLVDLDTVLDAMRGTSVYGDARRLLDESAATERAISLSASTAATYAGRSALARSQQRYNWFERNFYVRADKRMAGERQAQRAATLAGVGATIAANAVGAGVRWFLNRKEREVFAQRVLHIVRFCAVSEDGDIHEPNQALLASALEPFQLSTTVRTRVLNSPTPVEIGDLPGLGADGVVRDAVARYAFHARAHAIGPRAAEQDIVPVLIRLGMSMSGGQHFARVAHQEYLNDLDALSCHHSVLQMCVGGVALRLHLPLDTIATAAERVIRFDPNTERRIANQRLFATALARGCQLASMAGKGPIGPALRIADQVSTLLLDQTSPDAQRQVAAALTDYRQANGITDGEFHQAPS